MDRGLAIVLTVAAGAALSIVQACSGANTDDRPMATSNVGFAPGAGGNGAGGGSSPGPLPGGDQGGGDNGDGTGGALDGGSNGAGNGLLDSGSNGTGGGEGGATPDPNDPIVIVVQ